MKYLLLALIALFGALLCLCPTSADLAVRVRQAHELSGRALYEKELRYAGLRLVSEEEIANSLPRDDSLLWWHLHRGRIAEALEQHPLIAQAAVNLCEDRWWRCFSIKIAERVPRALVELKDGVWVVDGRGAFLKPVSARAVVRNEEQRLLPMVRGIDLSFESPELARARTRYAIHAVDVVEQESGRRVDEVAMRENGELALRFRNLRLTALFDADDELLNRVADEARRLRALITEFKGREEAIETIDLAYNRLAVVRLFTQ